MRDAAGRANDRATESLPRLGRRRECRRDSSLVFSRLLVLQEESQHHSSFLEEKGCEEDTDAQAGMPSPKLRRNMRTKIR